jgi:hypothetical protein
MSIYLPFDEDGLIEIEISITQNEDYDWVVEAEILQNLVFPDQDDPRRLMRFTDYSGSYKSVMSPVDDRWVPALPNRNEDGVGCLKHIQLVLPTQAKAQEAYNGILADLDEYILTMKAMDDSQLEEAETIWIEEE